MGVRVKHYLQGGGGLVHREATEVVDRTMENRETTVDGYTFHWGPNEVRNFLDDGVGAAHAAFRTTTQGEMVVEDNLPFGNSRF